MFLITIFVIFIIEICDRWVSRINARRTVLQNKKLNSWLWPYSHYYIDYICSGKLPNYTDFYIVRTRKTWLKAVKFNEILKLVLKTNVYLCKVLKMFHHVIRDVTAEANVLHDPEIPHFSKAAYCMQRSTLYEK